MPPRRPKPTAASRARAARIAAALSGILDEVDPAPPPNLEPIEGDPYRAVVPRPPRPDAERLACPGCGEPLEIAHQRGVEIHSCDHCLGIWLDPGELDELIEETPDTTPVVGDLRERMRAVAPPLPDVEYRRCPRCKDVMRRRNYGSHSGVIVDECDRHGMFLDPGDFDAIETFVKMGGLVLEKRLAEEKLRRREHKVRIDELNANAGRSALTQRHHYHYWSNLFDLF